jgi:uncharacterized protein (DUF2236 family)
MHRVVKGTGKDGTEFDATDPHQQAWVSMTLTDSILAINDWFGTGRLSTSDADQFVKEQSTHGALLDDRVDLDEIFASPKLRASLQAGTLPLPMISEGELPTTRRALRSRMREWTSELSVTPLTRTLIDATIGLTEVPPAQRVAVRPIVLATLSTIPDQWHRLLAPNGNRLEELAAAYALQLPMSAVHLLLGTSRDLEIAQARVAS